uniref:Uncharacterized protein n=1 Tax=Lepeophtheirus salmonis TaxID=72036 RepID=A0A0K2VKE2_LEPSM
MGSLLFIPKEFTSLSNIYKQSLMYTNQDLTLACDTKRQRVRLRIC